MNEADEAQQVVEERLKESIEQSRRDLEPGEPGECEECGLESKRLVRGLCAPCREEVYGE